MPSVNVQYYPDLADRFGEALESIVFLTHLDRMISKSKVKGGYDTGHWVAVQHLVKRKKVVIWDSMEGTDRVLSEEEVEEQILDQAALVGFIRSDSARLVNSLPVSSFDF